MERGVDKVKLNRDYLNVSEIWNNICGINISYMEDLWFFYGKEIFILFSCVI